MWQVQFNTKQAWHPPVWLQKYQEVVWEKSMMVASCILMQAFSSAFLKGWNNLVQWRKCHWPCWMGIQCGWTKFTQWWPRLKGWLVTQSHLYVTVWFQLSVSAVQWLRALHGHVVGVRNLPVDWGMSLLNINIPVCEFLTSVLSPVHIMWDLLNTIRNLEVQIPLGNLKRVL